MKKKRLTAIIAIILAVVILAGVISVPILKSKGYLSKGNKPIYSVASIETPFYSPIEGKTVIFLGSSVTYGSAARGESVVDYLEKKDMINVVKEAVPGTTLVDSGKESYIKRMEALDKNINADMFICQLSTNDATKNKKRGAVSESFDPENFDTSTIAGAIEYIIWYAKETWNCPVCFYTNPKYDSKKYQEMVDLLLEIQKKWDIDVIDLWNNEEFTNLTDEDRKLYQADKIHPTRAGYKNLWLTEFEKYLYVRLSEE